MKAAHRNESNTARITRGLYVISRALQGHSGGIPVRPEMMEYTLIPYNWKEYIFHNGILWNFFNQFLGVD